MLVVKKATAATWLLALCACQTAPGSLEGYCTASEPAVKELAAVLSVTPDEEALRKGDLVIRQRDAACP